MGKRIELTKVYRPKRETKDQRLKREVAELQKPMQGLGTPYPPVITDERIASVVMDLKPGATNLTFLSDLAAELARRKALKAAQMRRYRARKRDAAQARKTGSNQ